MRLRGAAISLAFVGLGTLLLHAVRPGVVENGARSPRAWLVVGVVLLAGRATAALLQRVTGRPWLARTVGVLVPLAATVALLAPSFQQRVLVEPFPAAEAGPVAAPGVPAPSRPTAPAPVTAPAPAPASATAASTRRLASGSLEGIGHSARGTTGLYATGGGTVLRFEDVNIEGTVEPVVYLVPFGARTPGGGVRIGPLKAERGSFGYSVPSTVQAERSWTVLVWCAPYDTPIAAADLPRP